MTDMNNLHTEADKTPQEFTSQVLAKGSSFYYSLLGVDGRRRESAAALFWLYKSFKHCCFRTTGPEPALAQLHWWQQEIERLRQASPTHPVTRLLADTGIPRQTIVQWCEMLQQMLVEFIALLQAEPLDSTTRLEQFGSRTGGHLGECMTGLMAGADDSPVHDRTINELGSALALSGFLKHIGRYARTRFDLLPRSWRERCGLQQWRQLESDPVPPLRCLERGIRSMLADRLTAARAQQRPGSGALLIAASLELRWLDLAAADPAALLTGRSRLTPLKKYLIARRIVKNEKAVF